MAINRKTFFAYARKAPLGGRLTQQQVDGIDDLLDAWDSIYPDGGRIDFLAYIFASVFHETGGRMVPVREGFASTDAQARRILKNRPYAKTEMNGVAYYGRGRVQNTWLTNYQKLEKRFDKPLVKNPDLLLDSKFDALVTIVGHVEGIWTKKKLADYFGPIFDPDARVDELWSRAKEARHIVNGTDKAGLIADYFKGFYAALCASLSTEKVAETIAVAQAAPTPAADPTRADGKPLAQSKTVWTTVLGTSGAGLVTAVLGGVNNPYAFGALALVIIVAAILAVIFRKDIRDKAGV
jgi:putative chitinase